MRIDIFNKFVSRPQATCSVICEHCFYEVVCSQSQRFVFIKHILYMKVPKQFLCRLCYWVVHGVRAVFRTLMLIWFCKSLFKYVDNVIAHFVGFKCSVVRSVLLRSKAPDTSEQYRRVSYFAENFLITPRQCTPMRFVFPSRCIQVGSIRHLHVETWS